MNYNDFSDNYINSQQLSYLYVIIFSYIQTKMKILLFPSTCSLIFEKLSYIQSH